MSEGQLGKPYPLDFSKLRKGDVIGVEKLEEIFCLKREVDFQGYQIAVMQLMKRIEDELESRGYPVTTKSDHGAIKILTDEEASFVNEGRYEKGIKGLVRHHVRMSRVDRGNLSNERRKKHDRTLTVNGATISAMKKTRVQMKLEANKRSTPLLSFHLEEEEKIEKKKDDGDGDGVTAPV